MVVRWLFSLVAMGLLVGEVQGTPPALSNRRPDSLQKSPVHACQSRVLVRQGGDTVATATPIASLPFAGSGTTEGFANDYDTVCPSAGSDSPDVVYSFSRPEYGTLTIDLCGSDYDTKIYVMSDEGQIFDCNDDYYFGGECGQHTSRIDNLWLPPGETYYLVVDGAGGAAGQYEFEVRRWDTELPGNGDTTLDPFVINGLPFTGSGTTVGYTNDYDEICPYSNSTAPDVVYAFDAGSSVFVDIDLCGSSYDTKLYVYDDAMSLIACNDDFYFGAPCGTYVSKVENAAFNNGGTYYIIIDGYGTASGAYVIDITQAAGPCVLECPADGFPEGEPPLVNDYVDNYNGGCNTAPAFPFQHLTADYNGNFTLCGVSGWYNFQGSEYRDTDWFLLTMGMTGSIEITVDGQQPTQFYELTGTCDAVGIGASVVGGDCLEAFMTISGYAYGAPVWFWAGPTVFAPPAGAEPMFDYVAWISGLEPASVTTEPTTWGTLKALYQ